MIIQTRASFSALDGYALRTEKVPGTRKEGVRTRISRGKRLKV